MARIVLTTFGSSGDIHPYIALGLGLRARGHDVLLAVEDEARPTVEAVGFPVAHLAGEALAVMAALGEDALSSAGPLHSVRMLVSRYIAPTLPQRIEDLLRACYGADMIVASAFQVAASFVHDLTQIPLVTLTLSPVTIPSASVNPAPPPFPLPARLEPLVNRASWAFGVSLMSALFDPPINRVRAVYRLPPLRHWMYTGRQGWSPRVALAVSPAFFPPPSDLPPAVSVTGFLYWDTPTDWQEPPALTAFLAGDAPVVAVSAGSMSPGMGAAFATLYQTSIAALGRLGARALILGAAPGTLPDPLPAHVLALPYAPFSAVYPRCSVVIHHGGMGTTAQGLRAGVPALVAPWGVDQFYTAAQIQALGVGRWTQRNAYTPERAARLLGSLLHDDRYRQRARTIAEVIAREEGVATLCALIEEELVRQRPSTQTPQSAQQAKAENE